MRVSNFRLGIGCPLSFPQVPSGFFDSFIAMEKPDFHYFRASNGPIEAMRNDLVLQAQQAGCSHLAMLDTDQVYEPSTLTRLLAHRLPVVGCLVYRRYPPFDPLLFRRNRVGFEAVTEWEKDALVEVDRTGSGCVLYDMAIFRVMRYPWFRFRYDASGGVVGEDFGFCDDLRARGYKIFVDTSVPAGHLTKLVVNEATHKLYRRMKAAEVEAAHAVSHGNVVTRT